MSSLLSGTSQQHLFHMLSDAYLWTVEHRPRPFSSTLKYALLDPVNGWFLPQMRTFYKLRGTNINLSLLTFFTMFSPRCGMTLNTDTRIMRTLYHVPLVSILTRFHRIRNNDHCECATKLYKFRNRGTHVFHIVFPYIPDDTVHSFVVHPLYEKDRCRKPGMGWDKSNQAVVPYFTWGYSLHFTYRSR